MRPLPRCSIGARWRAHRNRAASGAVDFLHDEVAERLLDRLDLVNREFPDVLDLGARNGALAGRLRAAAGNEAGRHGRTGDRTPCSGEAASGSRPTPSWRRFATHSFDLVVSNLVLHWTADLPGALVQLRRVLRPDGLLLAAMLGGQTLVELRTALFEAELAEEGGVSPRVSPAIELGDAAALLQRAGYALPVADSETITVAYPDLLALMRDLRGMGETNALAARRRQFMRRATLARAVADLCRALRRTRRPHPGDVRGAVSVRLGAASEPAHSRCRAAAQRPVSPTR